MAGRPHESKVNVALEGLLNERFGDNVWIAEHAQRQPPKSRYSRPDLTGFVDGIRMVIECSYDRLDAERDASRRTRSNDIVLALLYPDIPAGSARQIQSRLRTAKFEIMLVAPRARGPGRWTSVDFGALETYLFTLSGDLLHDVDRYVDVIRAGAEDFARHMLAHDRGSATASRILNLFYKNQGQDDWPLDEEGDDVVIYKKAYIAIVLSAIFYQSVRANHPALLPLEPGRAGVRRAIISRFEAMVARVNYEPVFVLAIETLRLLPDLKAPFEGILDVVSRISENPAALHKDLAGRIYHQVVGNRRIMKGLATYYTQIPASYLLARLAVMDRGLPAASPLETTVADFACGSGTLLMAAYSALADLHRVSSRSPPGLFHRRVLEENMFGFDILRYALQITSLNLLLQLPSETVSRMRLILAPLSGAGGGKLGSLELLAGSGSGLDGFLPYDPRVRGTDVFGRDRLPGGVPGRGALGSLMRLRAYPADMAWDSVVRGEVGRIVASLKAEFGDPGGFVPVEEALSAYAPSLYARRGHQPTARDLHALVTTLSTEPAKRLSRLFGDVGIDHAAPGRVPAASWARLAGMLEPYAIWEGVDPGLKYDLVIMNPPFTRASRGGAAGSTVFGFTGRNARAMDARFALLTRRLASAGGEDGAPAGSSALAGMGSAFLHLAAQYVKARGRIAFVAPRGLIQGDTWRGARRLLLSRFHIEYVITRMDGTGRVNFSESTSMGEALVIARRLGGGEGALPAHTTRFCTLRRPMSSILDAISLTARIQSPHGGDGDVDIARVPRSGLERHLGNWGRYAAFVGMPAHNTLDLLEGGRITDTVRLRMARLGDGATMGVVPRRFKDSLRVGDGAHRVVWGGGEGATRTIRTEPNGRCAAVTPNGHRILERNPGHLLVPDRIRLDTMHALALWCDERALSNAFYAVRLDAFPGDLGAHKAMCAWLNSIFGLAAALGQRTDTEGRWTRLAIDRWREVRVPDLSALPAGAVRGLAAALDRHSRADFGRLPDQFGAGGPREGFDLEVLGALGGGEAGAGALRQIRPLYRMVGGTIEALGRRRGGGACSRAWPCSAVPPKRGHK